MRLASFDIPAGGARRGVSGPGVGFRLVPRAPGWPLKPGGYPLVLKTEAGDVYEVLDGGAYFLERPFVQLHAESGRELEAWQLQTFESYREGATPGGKQCAAYTLTPVGPEAVSTVAAAAGMGWALRPGLKRLTLFFSGDTTKTAQVWLRSLSGAWYQTPDTIDPAAELVAVREQLAQADRVYLLASGAGLLVEAEATVEIGG